MKRFTKKIAFVMALVMVFALTSAVSANAADLYSAKYSFNSGVTSEGWLNATVLYSEGNGYGLEAPIAKTAGTIFSDGTIGLVCEDAALQDALTRTAWSDAVSTFKIDLKPGTYAITVYAGGASNNNTYTANRISIDGYMFDTIAKNSDTKSSASRLVQLDEIKYISVITVTEARTISIVADNTSRTWTADEIAKAEAAFPGFSSMKNCNVGDACGGRGFFTAITVEEFATEAAAATALEAVVANGAAYNGPAAVAETPAVPKDGESMTVAYIAALAVVSAGAAVLVSKKRKEA